MCPNIFISATLLHVPNLYLYLFVRNQISHTHTHTHILKYSKVKSWEKPIPVAAPSKAWDCGFESRQGIAYVFCEHCVLSGSSLSVGLITRPEESYRVWCVWVVSWSTDSEEALAPLGVMVPWLCFQKLWELWTDILYEIAVDFDLYPIIPSVYPRVLWLSKMTS
jgi:hypothetical protein